MQEERKEKIEVMHTAYNYLERLEQGIDECAMLFREKQLDKANEQLVLIVEGLEWLIDAISLTSDVREKVIDVTKMTPMLKEIVEAMQNTDVILVADLLYYEVLENVKEWRSGLGEELLRLDSINM